MADEELDALVESEEPEEAPASGITITRSSPAEEPAPPPVPASPPALPAAEEGVIERWVKVCGRRVRIS